MTRIVVDTTVASLMLDQRPPLSLYEPYLEDADAIYMSFQTVAEMRYGALKGHWGERRQKQLEEFLPS